MAQWTPEEQLAFDIAFGLKKVTIPGFRKALKEEDRFAIAAAIVSVAVEARRADPIRNGTRAAGS
jgi:hypothetical protein